MKTNENPCALARRTFRLFAAIGITVLTMLNGNAEEVKVVAMDSTLTVTNGKLCVELKKNGNIELSNVGIKNGDTMSISFLSGEKMERLKIERWNVEKDSPGESVITAYSENPDKLLAILTIAKDSEYVLVSPGRDIAQTCLEMRSQVSVLPDMLAEDYIYFPDKISGTCRIPVDAHCLLNLMNDGNTMAACLWTTDDTKVYLGKKSPESETIDYNAIECGKHKILYVGMISVPGIWHLVKDKLNTDSFKKVGWKAPFDADWHMTMKLETGVIPVNDNNFDTWNIPIKTNDHKMLCPRFGVAIRDTDSWTAGGAPYGGWIYPNYLDNGCLFARLPVFEWTGFTGTGSHTKMNKICYSQSHLPVIYAYRFGKSFSYTETSFPQHQPLLPYDKLKGVLPFGGILRLLAMPSPENIYPATCSVTEEILRYFKDDQAEEKRNVIVTQVDRMNIFVDTKDKRVNDYRDWALKRIEELKRGANENVKLKPLADEMIGYLNLIEKNYDDVKKIIKTPEDTTCLSGKYLELINDKNLSSEKKEEEVDEIGREIRTMGGVRDHLIAHMRLTVKAIRFHLTERLTARLSPEEQELVVELRRSCGDILWLKHGHEGK